MSQDESHLRLLSIFHYVLAALSALFHSIFLMHSLGGFAMWRGVPFFRSPGKVEPTAAFGLAVMVMGAAAVLFGWCLAACLLIAGRSLTQHKRYVFCLIVAG